MTDATDSVVIERTYDAPADLIWKMWTEAEHFAAWYGPMGAEIPVANMDVAVGGKRHICMAMETPNGPMQMWFVGEFVEITPSTRLVYTDGMGDEDGNAMTPEQMGMPPGSPATTEVVVELEDLGASTKVTVTHVGIPADSPGAAGWAMAMDKLTDHVAAQ